MWTIKVDISMLLMVFVNSKDYNMVGQDRFLLLSLTSSNIEIYAMHSSVSPFIEIVGLTLESMDFIFFEMNLIFLKMMDFISLLIRKFFIQAEEDGVDCMLRSLGQFGASGCLTSM